jgi:hypothetical protein
MKKVNKKTEFIIANAINGIGIINKKFKTASSLLTYLQKK